MLTVVVVVVHHGSITICLPLATPTRPNIVNSDAIEYYNNNDYNNDDNISDDNDNDIYI